MIAIDSHLAAITKHGYLALFGWITAEQLGLPVPAAPILLAAGVLSASGQLTWTLALMVATLGCLIGDTAWYAIGKARGSSVLRVLCKISLEPDTCVRRASEFIARHGGRSLLIAKFVPGVSSMAVPLAATSGISWFTFVSYDSGGSMLYAAAYLALGRFLGSRIEKLSGFADSIKNVTVILALLVAAIIVGRRFYRRRFQRNANVGRIIANDLLRLIREGRKPFIVDLRHSLDMLTDPRMIPGAIRMAPEELSARLHEIPRDREVVLYCTCPNEASSADFALILRRNGITDVRPLLGGFDEWKRRGYPVVDAVEQIHWRTSSDREPAPESGAKV